MKCYGSSATQEYYCQMPIRVIPITGLKLLSHIRKQAGGGAGL